MPNEFHNNKINRTFLKKKKKKKKNTKEFVKHPVPKLCLLVKVNEAHNDRNDTH